MGPLVADRAVSGGNDREDPVPEPLGDVRRLADRASCTVDVACASGLKTGLNSRRHHRQLRKSGKQFSMGAEEGNRAPPERSPEAIP